MAARPTTRHPAATKATASRGNLPPSSPVRDFAAASTALRIDWDVRPVYDLLFSLSDDAGTTDDLPAADRQWLRDTRTSISESFGPDVTKLFEAEIAVHVAAYAVERPDLRTVDQFVDAIDTVETPVLLRSMLSDFLRDAETGDLVERCSSGDDQARAELREAIPDYKSGFQALLDDPVGSHQRIAALLRAWSVPFREIEPRIGAILQRDHDLRAGDRATLSGSELIEQTTNGIRWLPEVGIRRVILAPSYFSRPYNFLLAGEDWRFFGYPVSDDALDADDRLAPPLAVVRLHRALGDETRLRILKLLSGRDLYLTEIAQQLDLSKPTIKHHLAILRSASLVTIVEAGSVRYYSLRRGRIDEASTELGRFLGQ
jgi:DNA-binding transcriptional ArsR family regulator